MRKQTKKLSPRGFQSPKFSDLDFREVRGFGRPKSSAPPPFAHKDLEFQQHIVIPFKKHLHHLSHQLTN
jgi:hypothetical protein